MLWEASKLRSSPAGIVIAAHMDSDNTVCINDMSLGSTGSTGVCRNLMGAGALPALWENLNPSEAENHFPQ